MESSKKIKYLLIAIIIITTMIWLFCDLNFPLNIAVAIFLGVLIITSLIIDNKLKKKNTYIENENYLFISRIIGTIIILLIYILRELNYLNNIPPYLFLGGTLAILWTIENILKRYENKNKNSAK